VVLESFLSKPGSMDVEVVRLKLKTYDCWPDVCLVVVRSAPPILREMTSVYRIVLIDITKVESAYKQIESLLRLRNEDDWL